MTILAPSTDFTASAVTQAGAKLYITNLRTFISDLLGTDSDDKPTTRSTLGVAIGSDVQGHSAILDAIASGSQRLEIPAGFLGDFSGPTPPTGYLTCPVAQTNLNRITYAALFAQIGTSWGAGDGSTTFGMPWFPNGYVAVQGTPGISTTGEVKSHTHAFGIAEGGNVIGNGVTAGISSGTGAGLVTPFIGETGGAANLPAGMGVRKCVKY